MRIRTWMWIGLGAVLMTCLFSGCAWFQKAAPYAFEDTVWLEFRYSTGYAMNASVTYTLTGEDGTYTATVKPDRVADEAATVVAVDEAFVKRVETMLASYDVQTWDGFQKSDKHVLDGDDFNFYIRNRKGQHIGASGYMKWPKHYKEVKRELDELFGGLQPDEEEEA